MSFDNINSGALFKNDRKSGDKDPDYRGTVNVAGREFWLSAWLKTSKKGAKFMSLSVKAKDAEPPRPGIARPSQRDQLDDDIPF